MNKKIFISFIIFMVLLIIPVFYQSTFCKYIFNYSFISTKIQIDRKPEIEVISTSNTNTNYEQYANNTHTITLTVKITENNIVTNNFNSNYIKILVNNEYVYPTVKINLLSNNNGELIYTISISNLNSNGLLDVIFPEGIIQDISGQKNDFQKFNTNILIDNLAPSSTCEELSIEDNKSNYVINSNEGLRPLDNWNISNNNTTLSKVFLSPIFYPIYITDYAGNKAQVFVDVNNARNIMLYYSNYNNYGISQFDSCGDISGKQAIIDSSNYKSEMLVTYLDGNIDKTALQARVFDYTYWGENTTAVCNYSEIDYKYGYSPSSTSWYDINGTNTIRFLGKLAIQLGGQGHNEANNSCSNIYNPIPAEIANKNLYGLSGIAFRLKNQTDLSIIYQIYVADIGWLKASSDGEETTYSHDKPFSAIRINIVPKSEKQQILNYWNTFIGTNSY